MAGDIGALYSVLAGWTPEFDPVVQNYFKLRTGGSWTYSRLLDEVNHYTWAVNLLSAESGWYAIVTEENDDSDECLTVYQSVGGSVWRELTRGSVEGSIEGRGLVVNNHLVVLSTWNTPHELLVSADGSTWVARSLPAGAPRCLYSQSNMCLDANGDLWITSHSASDGKVFATRTADLGQTWSTPLLVADFSADTDKVLWAEIASTGPHMFIAIDRRQGYPAGPVTHEVHLAYSHNSGVSWSVVNPGSPNVVYTPSGNTAWRCLRELLVSESTLNLWVTKNPGGTFSLEKQVSTLYSSGNPSWGSPVVQDWFSLSSWLTAHIQMERGLAFGKTDSGLEDESSGSVIVAGDIIWDITDLEPCQGSTIIVM